MADPDRLGESETESETESESGANEGNSESANVGNGASTAAGRRIRGLDAEQRRAARRRQLLDAALESFATNGFANTSIEQVCQAAYVGTKGFYEIFDSKEHCYLVLFQEITDRLTAGMVTALAKAPDDEAAAVPLLVAAFAHSLVDDPRLAKVTFGDSRAVTPAVERQRRTNRRWAATFIEAVWRRYGVVGPRDVDLHAVAVGVIGGMFDQVADWLQDADPGDADAVRTLVAGLTDFFQVVRAGLD